MTFGDHRCDPDGVPIDAAEAQRAAESVARALCLRQLDVRARTRVELASYLHRKGIPDEAADRVLDRFAEIGLIDDQSLAEAFVVARHQQQGLARGALAVKLRGRGVPDAVAASALGLVDAQSELVTARRLVDRRRRSLGGLEPEVQLRRLVSFLVRKGYPSGLAYRVVRESLQASHVDAVGGSNPDTGFEELAQLDLD